MFRPMKSFQNSLVLGRAGLALLLGAAACTGNLTGNAGDPASVPAASGSSSGSGGSGPFGGAASVDPQTGIPMSCGTGTGPLPASPALRLTNREYQNTLSDLFPGLKVEPATLA